MTKRNLEENEGSLPFEEAWAYLQIKWIVSQTIIYYGSTRTRILLWLNKEFLAIQKELPLATCMRIKRLIQDVY